MTQVIFDQESSQELQYPIQLRIMTKQETKQYHLKKLFELSLKSLGQIPQLEDPNQEQTRWVEKRLRGSARSWETSIEHKPWILRWHYFILEDYER